MTDTARRALFLLVLILSGILAWRWVDRWYPGIKSGVGGSTPAKADLLRAEESGRLLTEVASKIKPSVVFIRSEFVREERTPWGEPVRLRSEAVGSGLIVTRKGHIATNAHLVRGALRVTVTLADRREFQGELAGLDSATDLALIKIRAARLSAAPLSDSDTLQPGAWVLAVGHPLGLTHSVTFGIVSAVGRENPVASEDASDYIQTDASINPGNSGGPLVDLDGAVVGLNTFLVSPSGENAGAGFAVPSNLLRFVVESLIRDGRVVRGFLGVELQELTGALTAALGLPSTEGALVSRVAKGSPADNAGLKAGDVVMAFGRKSVRTPHDLRSAAARTKPGRTVDLTVHRDGKRRTLAVQLGRREGERTTLRDRKPDRKAESYRSRKLGLTVTGTPAEAPEGTEGVLIKESEWSGQLAANPHAGDLLLKVNAREIKGLDDFKSADRALDRGEETLLLISRNGALFYTSVKTR